MKKIISGLVLVLALCLSGVTGASASVDNISSTTNKVVSSKSTSELKVYVKNSSNKKDKYVVVELQLNGKTVDTKAFKVDSDKQKAIDFDLNKGGKYSIKTTVDKKSQKSDK